MGRGEHEPGTLPGVTGSSPVTGLPLRASWARSRSPRGTSVAGLRPGS